jgi:hypothetical protein
MFINQINLEANTKDKIDWLIKFVYQTVKIKYVYTISNDGTKTKYYNRENKWYDNPIDVNDTICDGYSDCELDDFENINEKIYYKFEYHAEYFEADDEDYKMNESDLNMLMNNNISAIEFESTKPIIINNRSGFNDDHRGADHTKILLGFLPKVKLIPNNNIIRFKDFIMVCFDMKSHKFDFWYELYGGVVNTKTDKCINITVEFDHGS